jgi:hypothetical protein
MVKTTDGQGFGTKSFPAGFIGEKRARYDFQGDVAAQLLIVRAKNNPHAARADLFDQTIVAVNLTDTGSR